MCLHLLFYLVLLSSSNMWLYTFPPPPRHKQIPLNAELLVKGRHGGFKRHL